MTKILALLLLVAPVALADSVQPSHSCSKPDVPAQFKDEAESEQFTRDVNAYHQCISAFVQAQNDAVHKHRAAAQQATDEWNTFANSMK
ncbi:hypothetical protein [Metapseudomonas resinovorans]|uniref:Uncharacterized protein n=1 Tax=Metapseudomonas resinovorans NBRC 106553 TaxID=1245471 RepID=S6AG26_METRE|nr:hypothetical protein [Pseudomonas resinovorans]BAN49102.1 hypothetical protein PCA10_33700 [Pseudomonas resinovorans NBRC 106553]